MFFDTSDLFTFTLTENIVKFDGKRTHNIHEFVARSNNDGNGEQIYT